MGSTELSLMVAKLLGDDDSAFERLSGLGSPVPDNPSIPDPAARLRERGYHETH